MWCICDVAYEHICLQYKPTKKKIYVYIPKERERAMYVHVVRWYYQIKSRFQARVNIRLFSRSKIKMIAINSQTRTHMHTHSISCVPSLNFFFVCDVCMLWIVFRKSNQIPTRFRQNNSKCMHEITFSYRFPKFLAPFYCYLLILSGKKKNVKYMWMLLSAWSWDNHNEKYVKHVFLDTPKVLMESTLECIALSGINQK